VAQTLWYFELLGRFRAESHARSLERFRTHKTASLLAFLVYHADRPHPRTTLIDQFWPESAPDAGQTNLRVALNSLRKQLEPPDVPMNSLLVATRDTVQLVSSAIESDTEQFSAMIRRAQSAVNDSDAMAHWSEAIGLYKGMLLPGHYDDWVVREQQRLETTYLNALRRMITLCDHAGDIGAALEFAVRAVNTDPLNEDLHAETLRLYIAAEQPTAAVRHYRQFERTLREQIDSAPSRATRALVERWLSEPTALKAEPAYAHTLANSSPSPPANSTSSPPSLPRPPAADYARVLPALPLRIGSFHGRQEESRLLLDKLRSDETAILTLTGPGGVGKTRLALELAAQIGERFPVGPAFVSLAEFTDAAMIPFAILQAFQIRVPKQIEPIQAIAEYLQGLPALIVLDNFEQLIPAGVEEISALRSAVPNLKLLITSRHLLRVGGEQTFAVLPLPIPPASIRTHGAGPVARHEPETDADTLLQNPSIRLFVERAQALRPDFQITRRNASDLAAICAHLEGMPLALELAASWINVLTPAQILERFQFPSRSLTTRRRDISPRHHTVENTVAWSYRLLSPTLQHVLRILSVFRGGWTLEALEAVASPASRGDEVPATPAVATLDPVEALAELQERSLIFASEEQIEDDARMRYRMLESVRQYCADLAPTEERQRIQRRHADYYAAFSLAARQDYDSARQAHAVARIYADYDNVLTAMEWFLTSDADAARQGMAITVNLYGMWCLRGMNTEGRHYLERALSHPDNQAPTAERASALNSVARIYSEFGDNVKALSLMYEALAIRKELGRAGVIGTSLNSIGAVLLFMGRMEEAFESYRQAVELFRQDGRATHEAIGLRNMCIACENRGDLAAADRYIRESLEICRREQFTHGIHAALGTLANLDYLAGRLSQARERYEESEAFYRDSQDINGLTATLSNLGRLYYDLGEPERSAKALTEALTLSRQTNDTYEIVLLFEHVAYVYQNADALTAARLSGAAYAGRITTNVLKPETDRLTHELFLKGLRARIGDIAFEAAFDHGRTMAFEAAIATALASLATGFRTGFDEACLA
jgi:predicted ATPase/DNA-binding SARP family transcriptional activator